MKAPTPGPALATRLGIAEGAVVCARRAPADYLRWLEPISFGVVFEREISPRTNVVHLFCEKAAGLAAELEELRQSIRPDGVVWVSWPKKASKAPTDITDGLIRDLALPLGFVDVKVCAVSEVWSGLKLVIRKKLR